MPRLLKWGAAALAAAWVGAPALAEPVVTVGDVPITLGFERQTVVEGLEHPWSVAWLPNGDMLITERPGRLRLVRDGRLWAAPIEGAPEVFASNQGGLLEVSVHPRFEETGFVYLTYAHGDLAANTTRVGRGVLDGTRLRDFEVIFETAKPKPANQHFGSRIAWLDDGTMLVSIGDGGNPPVTLDGAFIREQAQKLDSHWGKLLRLNDDGSAPADNPFIGREGALPEIWSYGHRHIQGLAIDRASGRVWATEHGALGGDELNRPEAGANHGWPAVSHSREYVGGAPVAAAVSGPGLVDPAAVWSTAIAPSGLAFYDGDAFPDWRGQLFAGGLITQDVRRLALSADGAVIDQGALRIAQRVRDVRQGPDGFLYVLTDQRAGSLLRLVPTGGGATAPVAAD